MTHTPASRTTYRNALEVQGLANLEVGLAVQVGGLDEADFLGERRVQTHEVSREQLVIPHHDDGADPHVCPGNVGEAACGAQQGRQQSTRQCQQEEGHQGSERALASACRGGKGSGDRRGAAPPPSILLCWQLLAAEGGG